MPLPAALLARLQKRGIVSEEEMAKRRKMEEENQPEEEIIAEDYDDDGDDRGSDGESDDEDGPQKLSVCPNQRNPYHECSDFCAKKWGFKLFKPEKENEKKRKKMMAKYPLPDNWVEEPDVWTGRYYYWNLETDEVSWLPPGHPKSKIGIAAKKIVLIKSKQKTLPKGEEEDDSDSDDDDKKGSDSGSESESETAKSHDRAPSRDSTVDRRRDTGTPRTNMPPPASKRGGARVRGRGGGRPNRGAGEDALDPMDPAAYSDVPRGGWSDGLPNLPVEAKSGVDPTASGALFQMRPYPSPGAVLKANAKAANTAGPKIPEVGS